MGESIAVEEIVITNLGIQDMDLFGKTFSVEIISVINTEVKQKYFYSGTLGLVAFKLTADADSSFFVLRSEKGLWAEGY
jgi:hypothetical protein